MNTLTPYPKPLWEDIAVVAKTVSDALKSGGLFFQEKGDGVATILEISDSASFDVSVEMVFRKRGNQGVVADFYRNLSQSGKKTYYGFPDKSIKEIVKEVRKSVFEKRVALAALNGIRSSPVKIDKEPPLIDLVLEDGYRWLADGEKVIMSDRQFGSDGQWRQTIMYGMVVGRDAMKNMFARKISTGPMPPKDGILTSEHLGFPVPRTIEVRYRDGYYSVATLEPAWMKKEQLEALCGLLRGDGEYIIVPKPNPPTPV